MKVLACFLMKDWIQIVCFVFFMPLIGLAQDVHSVKPYSTNQLPSQTVYGINQTSDGYIYLGTNDGLVKYNGISYETVETNTSGKAVSNVVSDDGDLYCLTFSKELIFLRKNMLEVYTEHDFELEKTSRLKIIGDTLFVLNKRGIIGLDKKTFEVIREVNTTSENAVLWDLFKDRSGEVQVLCGQFKVYDLNMHESSPSVGLEQKDCKLRYLKLGEQELVLDINTKVFYKYFDGVVDTLNWNTDYLSNQKIHNIDTYQSKYILLSSYNGLFVLDSKGALIHHLFEGIPVSETFTDVEGNIWGRNFDRGRVFDS